MADSKIVVPADGAKIHIENGKLVVPENPIIPFIEGVVAGLAQSPRRLYNAAFSRRPAISRVALTCRWACRGGACCSV